VFTQYSYGSPETWSWNFGDGASPQTITGAGPHTVKYLTMGDKTITCTITKGAEEVILVKQNMLTVTWPVDVETTNVDQKYSVYPNPASTVIKINGYKNGSVKIFNTAGAMVMDVESLPADGSLNISKLSGGMYIIKIQSNDGKQISKKLTILK
jgi:PKD repeat protein